MGEPGFFLFCSTIQCSGRRVGRRALSRQGAVVVGRGGLAHCVCISRVDFVGESGGPRGADEPFCLVRKAEERQGGGTREERPWHDSASCLFSQLTSQVSNSASGARALPTQVTPLSSARIEIKSPSNFVERYGCHASALLWSPSRDLREKRSKEMTGRHFARVFTPWERHEQTTGTERTRRS